MDHILELGAIVWELNRAGIVVPDEIQAVVLVNSLPRSWDDMILMITMGINKEVKGGEKLLDSVTSSLRDADQIRAMNERSNSNNNYQGKSKKGYKERY